MVEKSNPLFKPFMPPELPEINNILYSGKLSFGNWGAIFEQKLSEYISEKFVLTYNSYNSAMLALLTTMNLTHEHEVIASPMSCLASNQPFASKNIKIVWADIDPSTGTLDPMSVKDKLTNKTSAIFHNHYCGYPGYIDEINDLANDYGIPVVDDAIESFGSKYKGKFMGNLGTSFTVFSFDTVRLPNCITGGAIVFSNKSDYDRAKLIRDYGINRKNFRNEIGEINPSCDIQLPGYAMKPTEINSYIGVQQLKFIGKLFEKQVRNSQHWDKWIPLNLKDTHPVSVVNGAEPNYWVYGLLANNKRGMILQMRKRGYYASGVHLNNNRYSVFKNNSRLKGVDDFYDRYVAIPCGWWLN